MILHLTILYIKHKICYHHFYVVGLRVISVLHKMKLQKNIKTVSLTTNHYEAGSSWSVIYMWEVINYNCVSASRYIPDEKSSLNQHTKLKK